jgi:hypothetical protein
MSMLESTTTASMKPTNSYSHAGPDSLRPQMKKSVLSGDPFNLEMSAESLGNQVTARRHIKTFQVRFEQ